MAYKKTSNYMPGAVGFEQKSAMDTINQIIGLGAGLAQSVQANRDRRDAYNQRYLATLTQGFEKITDNNILQQRLDSLAKFKEEKIGNATAESMDMFNLMEQRLKNQMANNTDFDMKYQSMIDKHKGVADWVQMMYDYNKEGTTEEQRAEIRKGKDEKQFRLEEEANFKKMMQTYSYDLRNWYGKHGNRIDPYMMNDMVTSQSYMKSILDNWRADDKIDETEYNLYSSGISTGNYQDLKTFEDRRQGLADNLAATDIKQFQALKEQFDALGRALSTGSLSNLLYGQYINQDLIGGDEEGYTKLQPGDEVYLQDAQVMVYEELKKINSSITGAAYQDLMVRDESFEKVPEAYGFKGSWADYMKTIEKPFVPKDPKFKDDLTTDSEGDLVDKSKYIENLKESYGDDWKSEYDATQFGELEEAKKSKKSVFYTKEGIDDKFIKMGENDYVGMNEIKKELDKTIHSFEYREPSRAAKRREDEYKKILGEIKNKKNSIIELQKKINFTIKDESNVKRLKKEISSLDSKLKTIKKASEKQNYFFDENGIMSNKELDKYNYNLAKYYIEQYRKGVYQDAPLKSMYRPTIKMMGDRYISDEPVSPEEEILKSQYWKKQRPRD